MCVVGLILFLSKDFAVKVVGNCNDSATDSERGLDKHHEMVDQSQQRIDKKKECSEMDDSMDSSSWSDIDASTSRLAPNRSRR